MNEIQYQIDYVKALLEKATDEYEIRALEEELEALELELIEQEYTWNSSPGYSEACGYWN